MQGRYPLPLSKVGTPPPSRVGTPPPPRVGTPFPSKVGTPSPIQGRYFLPIQGRYPSPCPRSLPPPPRNVNRQTPVKTVPSHFFGIRVVKTWTLDLAMMVLIPITPYTHTQPDLAKDGAEDILFVYHLPLVVHLQGPLRRSFEEGKAECGALLCCCRSGGWLQKFPFCFGNYTSSLFRQCRPRLRRKGWVRKWR